LKAAKAITTSIVTKDTSENMGKIKVIIALSTVFLLIIATNLVDKRYFEQVESSITSIYEDRLVAKEYLFDMSMLLAAKQLAYSRMDSVYFAQKHRTVTDSIKVLLERYENTKMTRKEQECLRSLTKDVEKMEGLEKRYLNDNPSLRDEVNQQFANVRKDLKTMATIQVEEGKRQLFVAQKAVKNSNLISRMEIIAIILIGIVIQIIVLYNPKPKSPDNN